MKDFINNSSIGKFSFLLLSLSLIIGFYFNEISSGTGAKADFYNYWPLVLALKENFYVPPSDYGTLHLPLHYMILARLNFIITDEYFLRLFFCLISISVPLLFYLNLKTKFEYENQDKLWLLASLIFLFPSFRYSAIWANGHVTAFIFFLLSTLFFLKWVKKKDYSQVNRNLILQTIFLSLAVYTRQYYALIFLYFMFIYFQKLEFKIFLKISFFIFILSLPGWFLIYDNPAPLRITFSHELFNSFLINSSIISFYLIPIFFCLVINNKKIFEKRAKFLAILTTISILLVFLLSNFFDYDYRNGGGFFLKLSIILLNNYFLFYLTATLGLICISFLSLEDKNNLILFIIILLGFSAYVVYQKYFEPMIIFIFFLLLNSRLPLEFLKNHKNLFYLYIYVFFYFISAIINDVLQITRNL